jgi:hypothetical protein
MELEELWDCVFRGRRRIGRRVEEVHDQVTILDADHDR